MSKEPIDFAKQACDTMMRRYTAADLPPKGHFHYHQGVFLSGMYETYLLCQDETYFNYIKKWVDSCMDEKGDILDYVRGHLDDVQPGILLFPLLERTGEEKYRKALEERVTIIKDFPRNPDGGFWHMEQLPNQMWLDGLYMGGPICAEYAFRFGQPQYLEIAAEQALLMQEHTRDEKTGLWYHAWDYSKKAPWADPETGRSPEFWGRSIGWVPVAVLNELDFMEADHPSRQALEELVRNLLAAVCKYQSRSGLWYQVVDKENTAGNWPEISCSCLYTAAIYKAAEKGILSEEYREYADKGYEGVINSVSFEGGDIQIGGICIGTGVGDYAHYIARPVSVNDLHGMGAFLLMCTQAQRALR